MAQNNDNTNPRRCPLSTSHTHTYYCLNEAMRRGKESITERILWKDDLVCSRLWGRYLFLPTTIISNSRIPMPKLFLPPPNFIAPRIILAQVAIDMQTACRLAPALPSPLWSPHFVPTHMVEQYNRHLYPFLAVFVPSRTILLKMLETPHQGILPHLRPPLLLIHSDTVNAVMLHFESPTPSMLPSCSQSFRIQSDSRQWVWQE
jgi:hypothetical protein